jgi:quercetin dioxygenase-like cupin family protein
MKVEKLAQMKGGWFIGNFEPSLLITDDFEVAFKAYKKGDKEPKHFHRIAKEYTLIASGKAKMNGVEYVSGDIIIVEPNEATDFEAITDVSTVVVKTPSVKNDKFISQ